MPVLETIAAANAAFAVIKKCVENGSDIVNAGKAIAAFVSGKEDLQRQVAGKDKSKATGSDLEAFMQLEKLNQQEQELKKMMIYLGRPGLWGDYQKFCAQARRARREEEKQRMKKRKKMLMLGAICGLVFMGFLAIAGIVALVYLNANR